MAHREVLAHLNSLNGEIGRAVLLGPSFHNGQEQDNIFIFLINKMLCAGIFNWFVCQYYVDDKYGIIDEHNENYKLYKHYLEV